MWARNRTSSRTECRRIVPSQEGGKISAHASEGGGSQSVAVPNRLPKRIISQKEATSASRARAAVLAARMTFASTRLEQTINILLRQGPIEARRAFLVPS
jgi:hypothetical protein